VKKRPEIVVITGASAGVGRATAREFAKRGAWIGLIARGEQGLEAARREVEALGGRALVLPADVSNAKALDGAADAVEKTFGPIDVWVNNAFVGVFGRFMEMRLKEFRQVTEVSYFGQVYGTRAALKRMLPRNRGSIVLVGSALAYRGIPLQSAYCGAKHAIQGFQDSVRSELLHDRSKVRLTMVQLPAVNTPQFDWVRTYLPGDPRPTGGVYQPEVAARAIYFAAHSARKEVIVGVPSLTAIWADKLMSPLLDRYLARNGYRSQQDDQPVEPGRPDNLMSAVPGDAGAHGRFDDQARTFSLALWFTMHRKLLAAGLVAGVAAAATAMLRADEDQDGSPAAALLQMRKASPELFPLG
jgi:short-subunit dehydrogenase